jgi:hypothetical protein
MAKQTFTTGQVLTAAQVNSLQTNDFNQTVSAKTASYILVAADKGTRIEFNTSGSVTCTVNTGIFDAGDTLIVQNRGAGAVTITAGTATVNTSGSLVLNQYESGTLYFISASAALWFGSNPGDITGITTGATSGLTGGVTSGTADLKFNTTAKGGLLVGTGSGTVSELAVGTNAQILTADSTTATGLKWATASSTPSFKGVYTYIAADLTLSNNTSTAVTYDTELFDTDGFHSTTTNRDRITIPAGLGGYYLVIYGAQWNGNTTGYRQTTILKNNTSNVLIHDYPGFTTGNNYIGKSTIVSLAAGDYINVSAYQNSGGSLALGGGAVATFFSVQYLGA